jgi:pimeloyl-ACP methyl ester carboxylesterase
VTEHTSEPERLMEWFLVESWAEHLRQHHRVSHADADLQNEADPLPHRAGRSRWCTTCQPIVFSHGWPLSADMWDAQMLFFAERGYRAIAFDRRGFGRSSQPWTGYDYDTFADDLAELIETLDLKDVMLAGFSMGGGDVTRYIARKGTARVAKLALISAVTPLFVKTADHPDGPRRIAVRGHPRRPGGRPPAVPGRLQHAVLRHQPPRAPRCRRACSSRRCRSRCRPPSRPPSTA